MISLWKKILYVLPDKLFAAIVTTVKLKLQFTGVAHFMSYYGWIWTSAFKVTNEVITKEMEDTERCTRARLFEEQRGCLVFESWR